MKFKRNHNPPLGDEENFREGHHKLLIDRGAIKALIKNFKNEIFSLF